MAVTPIDPLLTAASGSVGDTTYGRNQFGPWTRDRVTPFDPATPLQLFMRVGMQTFTDRWANTLSPAQRQSWDLYARNVFLADRLGRQTCIGALAHYIRSALPRWQVSAPVLSIADTAPTLFDLGDLTPITRAVCNLVDGTIVIFFNNQDEWASEIGSGLLMSLSVVKPDTIRFYKGPYQFFDIIRGNPSPLPVTPVVFPVPTTAGPNEHYFFKGRVTRVDGRLTPAFRLDISAAPQVPAVPIALDRVAGFPPRFDVTFDDVIDIEPHNAANWFLRADGTGWEVLSVTTVSGRIRLRVQAVDVTALPDRVIYEPPPFDVKGMSTSLPVDPFVFFPK